MLGLTPIRLATIFLASVMLMGTPLAWAESHTDGNTDIDEALARRITEQVMRQLEESGYLQRQIEIGIKKFIAKQRAGQARGGDQRAQKVRRVAAGRDHIYGNPNAELSLIEYSDFECPFCKRSHPTARKAVDEYGGRVNWVYRHYPLGFHNPEAQKEAEASECAAHLGGNESFWRYTDTLYLRTRSNGKGLPMSGLVPLAGELGLDEAAFKNCLDSGKFTKRVTEDFAEGQSIGITGTPGNVLLNNRTGKVRLVSGAVPFARLKAQIGELLTAP